jgi:conjugative transfer ATPase
MFKNTNKASHITRNDIARSYQYLPSIVERLPWRDYNEKHKCFLLEDNESLGICFKITPIACEARPESMLKEIAKSISEAIKNTIPCEKDNPWILQVYVKKEADLTGVYNEIENNFPKERKLTRLTQAYLKNLKEHFDYVTRSGGIFHDSQVTNTNFRGGLLHVYAVLYQRKSLNKPKNIARRSRLEESMQVARKFSDQLRACGMRIRRMRGDEFYEWMVKWFNPKNKLNVLYPDEISKPIGFDLSEQLFFSEPQSFVEGWLFNGLPHKVITIQNMTSNPSIGHISAERTRNSDDKVFNFADQLPEGSVFSMTVVMQNQSEVDLHLKAIHSSAVGNHAQAVKVKNEIDIAEKSIADGDPLFPVVMNLYLCGESLDDLHIKESHAEVLLNSNGFKVITDDELFPIDAYLRYLPMCYDYHFDKRNSYRSRYIQLSDIAKLLPFYGRSRGTEHPGMVMFNRGGEPWFYDFMVDKTKNAHFLLLGETGTGKSNLLNYLIMQDLALYNSRFFLVEAGGSFDLLGDYCKAHGLTVNKIKIDPKHPVSLNPFAYGLRVIEQIESRNNNVRQQFIEEACDKLIKEQSENSKNDTINSNQDEEPRDILGDMVLAALIMITGGEKKEEDNIRRSDRMMIIDAIVNAAYFVRDQQRDQMIASDIVNGFERITKNMDSMRDAEKIRRANEMADAMRYFTNDPVSSQFFNSYGTPWPLVDITILDFGLFANEGYEAQRAIAFAGYMTKVLAIAEVNQTSNRSIKVVCDEDHIITSIPLCADIQTRISKMGRKLGLWLWLATQNVKDFSDNSRRLLAQIEHWICLSMPLDEINQIERFKTLTNELRALFQSAKKESGKYTEGIFLSPTVNSLFRNVPPKLYLAMAATEQSEKNHRANMMRKFNCSEIDAVQIIAREMMLIKHEAYLDD